MRGSLGIDVWALPMLMTRSPVESRLVVGEHQRVAAIGTSPELGAVGWDPRGPDGGRQRVLRLAAVSAAPSEEADHYLVQAAPGRHTRWWGLPR
jgi:hypothetical protein